MMRQELCSLAFPYQHCMMQRKQRQSSTQDFFFLGLGTATYRQGARINSECREAAALQLYAQHQRASLSAANLNTIAELKRTRERVQLPHRCAHPITCHQKFAKCLSLVASDTKQQVL